MTAATEGDLLTDLARLQDEAIAVVEAFENEPDMDTPEWHDFMSRVRSVSRRLNDTIRQLDQRPVMDQRDRRITAQALRDAAGAIDRPPTLGIADRAWLHARADGIDRRDDIIRQLDARADR